MRWILAPALAVAALSVTTPAHAAGDASIAHVEPAEAGLQILVSVPPDATVDTSDVEVTINGTPADAEAVPTDSTQEVQRTAVLVMDTSNSMSGDRIDAARAAAVTFLETVPDDVLVGIVTFDSDVSRVLEPTTDRAEARSVIDGLELSPETRLYDGVAAGIAMAGRDGQRQLLVLSDGADTSDTQLDDVTSRVTSTEVAVSVVALGQQRSTTLEALGELATAGDGEVIKAESKALERAFSAQADVLARQVLVTAQVPAEVTTGDGTVSVTLGSDAGSLTAEAFAPLGVKAAAPEPAGPEIAADAGPMTLSRPYLWGGLGALGLGLLVVLVGLAAPRKQVELTGADLATTYTERVSGIGTHRADDQGVDQAMASAHNTAAKVLSVNKSFEAKISERLEGAGNPFKPAEWLIVQVLVFIISGAVGLLLSGGNLGLGILFLLLGAVGPWMYLGFRRSRRRRAFERSLPDTLQLISGSLAAGLSLAQSIDTVVREGQEPISTELHRVLVETRLGISLDDALEGVADRFESKDFAWVVMAIRIQRQVGGNLAELLDTVAATMREREYMRRQVAALAAEGKLSAWVLGGLPPAFMLYLMVANPDYVMPMFSDPLGWVMIGGAVMLLSVGVFWMSRLIKVEV